MIVQSQIPAILKREMQKHYRYHPEVGDQVYRIVNGMATPGIWVGGPTGVIQVVWIDAVGVGHRTGELIPKGNGIIMQAQMWTHLTKEQEGRELEEDEEVDRRWVGPILDAYPSNLEWRLSGETYRTF